MFHNILCSDAHKDTSILQIPTINQDTGVAGSEPNETLKKIRSDKVLRPNKKQQGKVRLRSKTLGHVHL